MVRVDVLVKLNARREDSRSVLVVSWLKSSDAPRPYNVNTTTNGVLYIDLIDANSKKLVWQGKGTCTMLVFI